MPREYQDYSFVVTQVAGRRVKRLVGAVINEASDTAPCVVFAQLDEPQEWHRFFLQARIAFWEVWDDQKIEEEMDDFNGDDVRLADYAQLIGGLPMRIETARCLRRCRGCDTHSLTVREWSVADVDARFARHGIKLPRDRLVAYNSTKSGSRRHC
jgi:hypothetical protein